MLPLAGKVIYLGPGCGHVAYTLGFIGALLDDQQLREVLRSRGAVFGGTSSGAFAALYATASLHDVHNMAWWYKHGMRPGYEAIERHGTTRVMGDKLESQSRHFYREVLASQQGTEGTGDVIPWLQTLPVAMTEVGTLRPRFHSTFRSEDELAQIITSSSYVPGLMGLAPWATVNGSQLPVFDGYIGTWTARWPDNYLFVSFLPTAPVHAKHHLRAYEYDSTAEALLTKAWPWGDPQWADRAFSRGEADAVAHRTELRAALSAFLADVGEVSRA